MKSLQESLLDDDVNIDAGIIEEIRKFLDENYVWSNKFKISKKPKNGKYVVTSTRRDIIPKSKCEQLTNGLFIWGNVKDFLIFNCNKLKSLEGSPEVCNNFMIDGCGDNFNSLEGCPKEIKNTFFIKNSFIQSIKGMTQDVKNIYIYNCPKLQNFEGCPKELTGEINFSGLMSMDKNLKGFPEKVNKIIYRYKPLQDKHIFIPQDFEKVCKFNEIEFDKSY